MRARLILAMARSHRRDHNASLPITYYPRKKESLWHLVISVLLMFGGYLGWEDSAAMSIFCMTFFGICAAVFVIRLCDFSSYLRLDYDGFTICSTNRKHRVSWRMISHFYPVTIRGYQTVGWSLLPEFQSQSVNAQWCRSFVGIDDIMPVTYGPKPQALAALMNKLCQSYRIAHHYVGDSRTRVER